MIPGRSFIALTAAANRTADLPLRRKTAEMFYNNCSATLAFRLMAAFDDKEAECDASGKPIILA